MPYLKCFWRSLILYLILYIISKNQHYFLRTFLKVIFTANQNLIQYADFSGALSTSQIDALCAHKNSSLRSQDSNLVSLPISMLKNSAIGFKMRLGR
jgi:hypothetical protein